ncbi:MAG: hypothetical protein U9N45_07670, partial [Gemmatimonadota bacterium]|nr:hypothetical protein [Gemmatimonadota bacterium]
MPFLHGFIFKKAAALFTIVSLFSLYQAGILLSSQNEAAAPRAGYEYHIPVHTTDFPDKHGIHFKEFVNGSAYMPKYPFTFQRWDEPQLGELKQRLGLDELVKDARTEFEAVKRISRMVAAFWPHTAPVEFPSWNAIEMLDKKDLGAQYWCTYRQLITMPCLAALGIHSRMVPCHWHHCLEFWSNEYAKWIIIDSWWGNWYQKDGVPLGTLDLHRLGRETGNIEGTGVWEMNLNPNPWKPGRPDSVPAVSACYTHIRYIPRNDFLSAPLEPKPAGRPWDYLKANNQLNDPVQTGLQHIAWRQPGDPPTLCGPTVIYEQDYNFPLNEVEMDLQRPADREGVLDACFKTHTPEFDSYYIRIDSGEWASCGSRYLWELKEGENRLEVKTRNKWGRCGPVSIAVLEYRPEELKTPIVERLEIPDPGFEKTAGRVGGGDGIPKAVWKMNITHQSQEPAFHGAVAEKPRSGGYCYKIELREPPVWARLLSGTFRVNQASDVTLRVWLRADSEGREVTLFVKDATRGAPGSGAVVHKRVRVGC